MMSLKQWLRIACAAVSIAVALAPAPAFAQGGTSTASISGKVTDATGGVLPGVTVTITYLATNQQRTAVSNEEGVYRFAGLLPGKYSISAELEGFAKFLQSDITLQVGGAFDLNVTMRLSTVSESVTVTGQAAIVESAKTDLSTVISRDQIETLPTISRNFLDYALLTPGVNEDVRTTGQGIGLKVAGARDKDGALLVDGLWNTDESFTYPKVKYSQDAIAEFQVETIGGAAEFGRSVGGIVSAVTKSGSNAYSGSGYGYFRNKSLNGEEFLSAKQGLPKAAFDREQWGGSFGGRIIANKTFFFTAADRSAQTTPFNNGITAANAAIIGLPATDVGNIDQYLRDTFSMAKLTHVANSNNTLTATYAMTYDVISNFNSAFATRGRSGLWHSIDNTFTFQWTRIAHDGNWLHDLKTAYLPRNFYNTDRNEGGQPLVPDGQLRASLAPSVNITQVANFGGGYDLLDMFTKPFQVTYSTTVFKNNHSFKVGGDAMGVHFLYLRYQGPQSGSYSFSSMANFLAGRYTTYTQSFGPAGLARVHTYLSGYAQDSWAANKRLTVNYGIRWDGDDITAYRAQDYGSSWKNFGPRLAVSYDVTGKGTTLLKVGTGLMFDRLWENPITPTYYNNEFVGQQISATWNFGQPGSPVYPSTIPGDVLPANAPVGVRNVFITPDPLRMPETLQFITTLDRAWTDNFSTSISGVGTRSWNKENPFDTNLVWGDPANPNGLCCFTRANPNFRQIQQYQYRSHASYAGMVLSAQRRLRGGLRFGGNMTIARAYDQGENYSTLPNDNRYFNADYGPSGDVPTFTATANGSKDITKAAQFSWVFHVRSGLRIDPKSGPTVDVNGDGSFNDRTPGLTRNSFEGPWTHSLDMRLTWNVPIASTKKIQLTAEAFNIYNKENWQSLNTLYGPLAGSPNPVFGTPLSYYPPRQVQLGARLTF
jgi:Carboxypeptidase regulatory-like domain